MRIIAQSANPTSSSYSVMVTPEAYLPSSFEASENKLVDIVWVEPVPVHFKVTIDAQDWGIAGISVDVIPSQASLQLTIKESVNGQPDQEYVKMVTFDPSQLQIEFAPGNEITFQDMEFQFHDDLSVDYKHSFLRGTTLMRGE